MFLRRITFSESVFVFLATYALFVCNIQTRCILETRWPENEGSEKWWGTEQVQTTTAANWSVGVELVPKLIETTP